MKRAMEAPHDMMPAEKAQNTGAPPPEGQGETWSCKQCQNVNWPLRTTCNNKKCNAPGPWTCPACSNKNFQGRLQCNRPNCRAPMPGQGGCGMGGGYGMKGGPMVQMQGYGGKGGHQFMPPPPPPFMGGFQVKGGFPQGGCGGCGGGGAGPPPGSWSCPACNNVNWPLRSSCNNKQCGAPKPQMQQVHHHQMGGAPGGKGCGGGKAPPPEGSWKCLGCENVNWPLRQTCNNKVCGLPRDQADGGPPPEPEPPAHEPPFELMGGGGKGKGKGPPPEQGETWPCPACGNVNWPLRTTCNNKTCGQPKPEEAFV